MRPERDLHTRPSLGPGFYPSQPVQPTEGRGLAQLHGEVGNVCLVAALPPSPALCLAFLSGFPLFSR